MVRFNNLSVLRRLDLDNAKSVQKVLDVLTSKLQSCSTTLEEKTISSYKLTVMEAQWVKSILKAIERNKDYSLLMRAMVRLCVARKESPAKLNKAIQELEDLANEDVLIVPESHLEEYDVAMAKFNTMPPSKKQTSLEDVYVLCHALHNLSSN